MSEPPSGVETDYPLARLTTVRTGGAADLFARPGSEVQLTELLAWAAGEGLAIGVIGSGSNLLVADDGFHGLALKLDDDLSAVEREGTRVVCGGGARLPSATAKTARWGLTGLEFGINIPGTVGGAVRMNANAYGGQLARVDVVDRDPRSMGGELEGDALTDAGVRAGDQSAAPVEQAGRVGLGREAEFVQRLLGARR